MVTASYGTVRDGTNDNDNLPTMVSLMSTLTPCRFVRLELRKIGTRTAFRC